LAGAAHFLEALAFKGSATVDRAAMQEQCTRWGITTSVLANREVLMFKLDCLRGHLQPAMDMLASTVQHPSFTDADMADARSLMEAQRYELMSQPQLLVQENLYKAAYGEHSELGRPDKCPEARVAEVRAEDVRGYHRRMFVGPRMVLTAVSVDHDAVVAMAERLFADTPASTPEGLPARPHCPYLGGDVRSSPDWASMPPTIAAATAKTEFTHLMLAFPTVGWSEDDVVPVCVTDTLLGGGSSFSAGGPGKGMYSRLYREVLNSYSWVEACNGFSVQLYDSGLVGIYGATLPQQAGALTEVVSTHLARLTEQAVKEVELSRARNQLASSVMMNLETRGLLVEDIGRQFLSHNKRMDPAELLRRIQAVKAEDIMRVMRQALLHPPAFAAVGDVATLPDYGLLRSFFDGVVRRITARMTGGAPIILNAAGQPVGGARATAPGVGRRAISTTANNHSSSGAPGAGAAGVVADGAAGGRPSFAPGTSVSGRVQPQPPSTPDGTGDDWSGDSR
jgi:mitochondrial-processing peptidase subunit alpha